MSLFVFCVVRVSIVSLFVLCVVGVSIYLCLFLV